MTTKNQNNFFKSSDLHLIAFLQCKGYYVSSFEKLPNKETIFYIERDDQLDNIVQQYFSGNSQVEPIIYMGYIKAIKSYIYHT